MPHISNRELSTLMSDYLRSAQLFRQLSLSNAEHNAGYGGEGNSTLSPETHAILARLTIWLFWVDTRSCLLGGGEMARLISRAMTPVGFFGMYEASKGALRLHWSSMYPDHELADEFRSASALELVHYTWIVVQEINEALLTGSMSSERSRQISGMLDALRWKGHINSVFQLTESPMTARDRLLANADWGVASFHAARIYNFRCSLTEEAMMFSSYRSGDVTRTVNALLLLAERTLGDKRQRATRQDAVALGLGGDGDYRPIQAELDFITAEPSIGA
jgi:hypothetical protein